ncbi:MAG: cytochrome C oxidase subunit IV family protein [Bacteriovoracaceae bacterium]
MGGHSQTGHKSHMKEYMVIFFLLTFLTVIEVYVPSISSWSKLVKGVALTTLAIIKAWAVAYFYMHLKDEKGWLQFIAAIPLVSALYAYVLVIESIYR